MADPRPGTTGNNLLDVLDWLAFHPATPVTGPRHDQARALFQSLVEELWPLLPGGPHRTLAMRNIQQAMWAVNACIAIDTPPSE